MKLFQNIKKRKRNKNINWMTVVCDNCSSNKHRYRMFVCYDEIEMTCTGYRIQLFAKCTKCGKSIPLDGAKVPTYIWDLLTASRK